MDVYEHRVLTLNQIFELHFTSLGRARKRLLRLTELKALTRFRPPSQVGSHPYHYVLDVLGAKIVAARKEIEFKELKYNRDKALARANSSQLRHTLEVNDFFCRLSYACRMNEGYRLAEWWGQGRCASLWDGPPLPDGFARLEGDYKQVSFFLELDRGTEPHQRLFEKLRFYKYLMPPENYADAERPADALLFCFPGPRREREARGALWDCGLTIATTTLDSHMNDPLGPIWLPLKQDRRVGLIEL